MSYLVLNFVSKSLAVMHEKGQPIGGCLAAPAWSL